MVEKKDITNIVLTLVVGCHGDHCGRCRLLDVEDEEKYGAWCRAFAESLHVIKYPDEVERCVDCKLNAKPSLVGVD